MALPTTLAFVDVDVEDAFCVPTGPFKIGSNYYFVGRDASVATNPIVLKATDPTSSWSEVDAANAPNVGATINAIAAVSDGTTIHIVTRDGSNMDYHTFVSDAWSTTNESILTDAETTAARPPTLALRSDGDVLLCYQGPTENNMGTGYTRIYIARRESGTWTTAIEITGAGKAAVHYEYAAIRVADSTNDRAHVFYNDRTNNDLEYSTYLSGNTWGHQGTAIDTSSDASGISATSFDDGGTTKIRCCYRDNGGTVSVAGFNDADSPSASVVATDIFDSVTAGRGVAMMAYGDVQYALLSPAANDNIDITNTGAGDDTWVAPSNIATSTTDRLISIAADSYTQGGSDVLGFVYLDGSTYYYDEYALSAAAITITAEAGSHTLSGQAAALEIGYEVAAAAGSHILSGQPATLTKTIPLTAEAGAHTLSGQAAALEIGYSATAEAGSHTLSGQAASLEVGYHVTAEAGSYTLGGQAAALEIGYSVIAGAGSHTLSGQAAAVEWSRIVTAEAGSHTLSGQPATLNRGKSLTAEAGAHSLSGQAAALEIGYVAQAGAGAHIINGQAATLEIGYQATAEAGSHVLNGQNAGLTVIAGLSLQAGAGAHLLTGQAATLTKTSTNAAGEIIHVRRRRR